MSLEQQINDLTIVVETNTLVLKELIAALGATQIAKPQAAPEVVEGFRKPVDAVPSESPTKTDNAPAADAITYVDHVKPITLRVSQEKGKETAIAILGRFGVKGAQGLAESQWSEYVAKCEAVLNGENV
jgi:hypothetical protein